MKTHSSPAVRCLLLLMLALSLWVFWSRSRDEGAFVYSTGQMPATPAARAEAAPAANLRARPSKAVREVVKMPQAVFEPMVPSARAVQEEAREQEKALLSSFPGMAGRFDLTLIDTAARVRRDGEASAIEHLRSIGSVFADGGRGLALVIFPQDSVPVKTLETSLQAMGVSIIRADEHTIKIALPPASLEALGEVPGIAYARTVRPPRETVVTQGVSTLRAGGWHTAGSTGTGVKVAVVDGGFANHATLITQGELPASLVTVNYSSQAMNAGTSNHGSACAEIVYDMAPGVELVLIKVDDPVDLVTAAAYCISNGVKVVTCSLGYDVMNFHDGLPQNNWFSTVATHPITAVQQAEAAGIVWVNSAGNERRQHTLIDWVDAGADKFGDWSSTGAWNNVIYYGGATDIPAGVRLNVMMTWNAWPVTNQDFDLMLYKKVGAGSWTQVSASSMVSGYDGQDPQTGSATSYPSEEIIYTTTDASAQYAVTVYNYNAATNPKFILRYYSSGSDPEPLYFSYGNTSTPPPGSLAIPADSASAFSVGGLDWNTYATGPIDFYSSLGPNNRAFTGGAAVMKPDICGPTWVDTSSYGPGDFGGTSAATPHIAGLAALARAAYPTLTVAGTRSYLEAQALDKGTAGKDNTFGAGAGRMPAEGPPLVISINRAGTSPAAPGSVSFDVTFSKSVTGVTSGHFQLVTSGVTGAAITNVTGSGTTRTVTVSTGTGNGSIGLNMTSSTGAVDGVGNQVAGLPFTGQIYTIELPQVTLAVSPSSMNEDAAGALAYTFTRTGSTTNALTVNFSVGGTATLTTDYTQSGAASFTSTTGTATFAAGASTAVVNLDPVADTSVEADETVILTVTTGSGYTAVTPLTATGTFVNDDTSVTLAVSPVSMNEDAAGTLAYTFTRTGVTAGALTVNFSVSGSAAFSTDYAQSGAASFTSTSGTVSFAAGASTAVVSLDPLADTLVEADETAILTVTTGSGYSVGTPSTATGTFVNDDATVTVVVIPASMSEDAAGTLAYVFTRTGVTAGALTVNFSVGGTATLSTDYTQSGAASFSSTVGTVTFTAGVSTVVVNLDPVVDTSVEADETVILTLTAGSGYTAGAPPTATGTFVNDDTSVTVAVSPASMNEDAAGTLAYTFTRTGVTAGTLTVSFSVGGTATLTTDYTQNGAASFTVAGGTVSFTAGSSTVVVNLDPVVDTSVEADETVLLTVTTGSGYSVGSPSAATGTFVNDDTSVTVAVVPASMAEDAAGTLAYTFTRTGITNGALTVSFSVGGTATFTTDYTQSGAASFTSTSGTVSFSAGASTAVVSLDPVADTMDEPDEGITLTVTNGSGYTAGTPASASATILDDDNPEIVVESPSGSGLVDGSSTINFGTLYTTNGQQSFTIRNTGTTPLTGLVTSFTGSSKYSASSLSATTLAPGASTSFTVTLDGNYVTGAGTITGTLRIANNDGDENPFDVNLTGVVQNPPQGRAEYPAGTVLNSGSTVSFGSVQVGTSVQRTITLRNTGLSPSAIYYPFISKTGSNAFMFGIVPGTIADGGSDTLTLTFSPWAVGSATATIQDLSAFGFGSFTVTGEATPTPQQSWRQTHFGTMSNAGNAADTSDPDGDGMVNLMEFARGTPPTASSAAPMPLVNNAGTLELTYSRSTIAAGPLFFYVVWTDSLGASPVWSASGVTQTVLSDNGTMQQVRATLSAGAGGRRFVRLVVSTGALTF